MEFKQGLKNAWSIIKLDGSVVEEVARDERATGITLVIVVLAGIAMAIGMLNPLGLVLNPIANVIGLFIGAIIYYIFALIFGGRAKLMQLVRPLGHNYLLLWISVIPVVGPILLMIAGLWSIVVNIVIVKHVFDFSTGKAVAVVLIPIILLGLLAVFIAGAFVAAMMSAGQLQVQ